MNHNRLDATKQLEIANTLTRLWEGLFPDFETPALVQFLTWAATVPEATAAYAFNRARSKSRRQPMTSDELGRYISGVMKNEREGRHTFHRKDKPMTTENLNPTLTEDEIVAEAVQRLEAAATHGASDALRSIAEEMIRAGETFADARAGLEHNSVKSTQQ